VKHLDKAKEALAECVKKQARPRALNCGILDEGFCSQAHVATEAIVQIGNIR
jgi:hypothetical protein